MSLGVEPPSPVHDTSKVTPLINSSNNSIEQVIVYDNPSYMTGGDVDKVTEEGGRTKCESTQTHYNKNYAYAYRK